MSELYDKLKSGEITPAQYQKEMRKEQLKNLGFEREIDWRNAKAIDEGFESHMDKVNKRLQKQGYNGLADKQKQDAQKQGYKSHPDKIAIQNGLSGNTEYVRNKRHEQGINKPMNENPECSAYLGCYIGEPILEYIYNIIERKQYGNIGYDYLCNKNYKIDVKAVCLDTTKNRWEYHIYKNKVADYFLLLAFDNRHDLNLLHVWLFKGTTKIKNQMGNEKLNNKASFSIMNITRSLCDFYDYEKTYELEHSGKMDTIKQRIEEIKITQTEVLNSIVCIMC